MISRQRFWAAALLLAGMATCAVVGCGSKSGVSGVKVKGVLLFNGKALKVLKDESIMVGFSKDGIGTTAEVKAEDATFEINGPTDDGIPPGTYKISVSSQIYGGDGRNRFEAMFDAQKTSLTADVGDANGQMFEIDLGKKTVTKK